MTDGTRSVRSAVAGRRAVHWWLRVMMAGLIILTAKTGCAAEYSIGPVPAWVIPVAPGISGADQISDGSDGVAYLLTDTQTLAGAQNRVRYRRLVTTALNPGGVEKVANIEIPFDPSYQTLVLHSINIVRAGHIIPKLATAKIRVIEREAELEARIYDGTKTVNVFLDDVRVGDTIDYAYSVTGRNSVFKGRDFSTFFLQYGIPVARVHERVLLPSNMPVNFRSRNTAMKAVVSEHDGLRDYRWDALDPVPVPIEQGAPDWYQPFAEVSWSEFADWADVARWALPLYQVPTTLSPELQAQVDSIARAEKTPAGRMLAALRLVQADVRYLGVEIGQNSHAPTSPAVVFARRFGDCKDKTLLTLALLDRLGVEAHAALVNTRLQRGLSDALPNPGAFDHVLVQAQVDGKTWWLDPTRYTQRADLDHLSQPDFGLALIVATGTRNLVAMPRAALDSAARSLLVRFDASAGFDKPVGNAWQMTTQGTSAETLRAILASTNLADVQKSYLNFYANDYPRIKADTPLNVHDDEQANRITLKENFVVADMSSPSEDGKRREANIGLPDIRRVLHDPAVTIRKSPLQLAYPLDISQRTEVLLPTGWPIKPGSTTVNDAAFRFEQTERLEGSHLIITDHFQNLTDEVPAGDMARYLGHLARARSAAGYHLTWSNAVANTSASDTAKATALDRMNWPVVLLGLVMFGVWSWLAVVAYRHDPSPSGERDRGLSGLGGWLILLGFGVVVRPAIYVFSLSKLFNVVSIDKWAALTTFGRSAYNALWAPTLLFDMTAGLGMLVFSLLLALLFFRRRSSFPRVAVIVMLAGIVMQAVDVGMLMALKDATTASKEAANLLRSVIAVAIWWAYLVQSQRVKNTFVERYRLNTPPPRETTPLSTRKEPVRAAAMMNSNGVD